MNCPKLTTLGRLIPSNGIAAKDAPEAAAQPSPDQASRHSGSSGELHRAGILASPLGGGAYVVQGGISNAGFVIGRDGVVAIDAQFTADDARAELAEIARITRKPVTTMILTHGDNDHVNGLPAWPAGMQVIAQENTKSDMETQIASTDPKQMSTPEAAAAYLPTRSVRRSEMTVIEGVRVMLTHVASGHTDSDLVAYFPDQGVAYVGDLLTLKDPNLPGSGHYPIIRIFKHGSVQGWIDASRAVLATDAHIFVGGHGPQPVSRAEFQAAVNATEERREEVKRLFDEGCFLPEIKTKLCDPPRPGPLAFLPTFVDTTYQELLRR